LLTIHLPDSEATQRLGQYLGRCLPAGTIILLEGDLGAGKTTLVQGIGQGLGIEDPIVSPTFTLVNEYTQGRLPLYHLDLYRLQPSEIGALYPELYWEGQEFPPGITAIEWAQRLPYYPSNYLEIQLIYSQDQGRQVGMQLVGKLEFSPNFWTDLTELWPDQERKW
jgi:tRNA threonylcarbamoyladenosine biosynthesis protein TsaE